MIHHIGKFLRPLLLLLPLHHSCAFGFPRFPWRDGLKWVSIRKSEGITAHERFSIACTKWLYLPYVVCRRKGAATAAARLSFLSPSLHGYPNFTPESQYLLITLEGIVLYSPLSLSFSSLFPPPPLSPARPLHVLLRPTFFSLVFFFPPSHVPPYFSRKRETRTGWFFAPVALSSRRSQLFFAILLVLSFRG